MTEFIDKKQRQTAIVLAKTLSFSAASERLRTSEQALRQQIADLEVTLSLSLFRELEGTLSLTDEGRYLIEVFQERITES